MMKIMIVSKQVIMGLCIIMVVVGKVGVPDYIGLVGLMNSYSFVLQQVNGFATLLLQNLVTRGLQLSSFT